MVTETHLLYIIIVIVLSLLLHLIFTVGGHKRDGGAHGR